MQRQQPLRAAGRPSRRAANELLDGGLERERARLDLLAQRVPGVEPVLARDHRLRVVEREADLDQLVRRFVGEGGQPAEAIEGLLFLALRRTEQRLGLLLQLLETGTIGKRARHHDLHAWACGSQTGSTAVDVPWSGTYDSGLGPSREPAGAF
jgi:hypothetical protein